MSDFHAGRQSTKINRTSSEHNVQRKVSILSENEILGLTELPEVFQGLLHIKIKHKERMLPEAENKSIADCHVVKKFTNWSNSYKSNRILISLGLVPPQYVVFL